MLFNPKLTSPCPILVMLKAWLGNEKYQFLKSSVWLDQWKMHQSYDVPKWEANVQLIQKSHLVKWWWWFNSIWTGHRKFGNSNLQMFSGPDGMRKLVGGYGFHLGRSGGWSWSSQTCHVLNIDTCHCGQQKSDRARTGWLSVRIMWLSWHIRSWRWWPDLPVGQQYNVAMTVHCHKVVPILIWP